MKRRISSTSMVRCSLLQTPEGRGRISALGISEARYAVSSSATPVLGMRSVGHLTAGRTARTSMSYQIADSCLATSGVHALRLCRET